MTTPPPPQGFLGLPDLGDIVGQVTKILPPQVGEAIQDTVGKILDPTDATINIGDPQPEGEKPIPVNEGTEELSTAVKAIDTVTEALGVVLKFGGFVLPDKYEKIIKDIQGALGTIRSWLV